MTNDAARKICNTVIARTTVRTVLIQQPKVSIPMVSELCAWEDMS